MQAQENVAPATFIPRFPITHPYCKPLLPSPTLSYKHLSDPPCPALHISSLTLSLTSESDIGVNATRPSEPKHIAKAYSHNLVLTGSKPMLNISQTLKC